MKAIVLTRGRIATVDDKDFNRVNQFKWRAQKVSSGYYAVRSLPRPMQGNRQVQTLSEFLLGVKGADHKNGDKLDYRRENLRAATHQQNTQAFRTKSRGMTSQYRGVSWHPHNGLWQASIRTNRKQIFLGYFDRDEDAARAYDKAARELFGEFASPNFP